MKILLSIKPEYVERIFSGEKKYEYRRMLFKRENIETVIVYSTKPIGKVVGEFQIEKIICDTPKKLWEKTKKHSGIEKKKFETYFESKEEGFAIKIKNPEMYDIAKELEDFNPKIKHAPQSFIYVS